MTFRKLMTSAASTTFLFLILTTANAQRLDGRCASKTGVLDVLFPSDLSSVPYFEKLTMRFGDSDTQLAVLIIPPYPVHLGDRADFLRHSLAEMGDGELSQTVSG